MSAKCVKANRRYRLLVMKGINHRVERYSIGNIVHDIVIALYEDRWVKTHLTCGKDYIMSRNLNHYIVHLKLM